MADAQLSHTKPSEKLHCTQQKNGRFEDGSKLENPIPTALTGSPDALSAASHNVYSVSLAQRTVFEVEEALLKGFFGCFSVRWVLK